MEARQFKMHEHFITNKKHQIGIDISLWFNIELIFGILLTEFVRFRTMYENIDKQKTFF